MVVVPDFVIGDRSGICLFLGNIYDFSAPHVLEPRLQRALFLAQ